MPAELPSIEQIFTETRRLVRLYGVVNLSLACDPHSSIWQIAYDPKQTCKAIYPAKFDIFLSSINK